MSAAILVSQTWQPTVLQLMPFSSNNASALGNRSDAGGKHRDFPTLAVTRSHDDWVAHLQTSSKVQRATSERMPRSHYNQLTGRQNYSKRAQSEYKLRDRHKPEASLEKTCSVNDLNNKIIHATYQERESPKLLNSGTVSLTEIHGLAKPLQNHASQRTWDGHYYLPQNGFWRAMTLTPGELDLQKHREMMNKDQAKRTKKLKMNINQLPRSNTPINDNDPDKLNMHQVIQFLKNHNDVNDEAKTRTVDRYRSDKSKEYFLRKRGCASASVEIAPKPSRNGVTKSTDLTIPKYSRDAIMASTRSSPLLRGRTGKQTNGQNEWKPVEEGESVFISSGSNRPFRLHRFLNMKPTACESSNTMNRAYTQVPCSHTLKTLEITDQIQLPKTRHDLHRFDPPSTHHKGIPATVVDRNCKLAYRLPAKRPSPKPSYRNEVGQFLGGCSMSADCNHSVGTDGAVIRLPSMHDFKNESDNESEGDDEKHNCTQAKSELVRSDTIELSKIPPVHTNKVGLVESSRPLFSADSGFRYQAEMKPSLKKLHVSVPRESNTADVTVSKQSHECIKLSLRQGRGLTRENTYMTDLDRSKYVLADSSDSPDSSNKKSVSSLSVDIKTERDDDDISSRTS